MHDIMQVPAPKVELVERGKARLAYTRKDGWIVVRCPPANPSDEAAGVYTQYSARPGGKRVMSYEVLAWADLPPVPETAA